MGEDEEADSIEEFSNRNFSKGVAWKVDGSVSSRAFVKESKVSVVLGNFDKALLSSKHSKEHKLQVDYVNALCSEGLFKKTESRAGVQIVSEGKAEGFVSGGS